MGCVICLRTGRLASTFCGHGSSVPLDETQLKVLIPTPGGERYADTNPTAANGWLVAGLILFATIRHCCSRQTSELPVAQASVEDQKAEAKDIAFLSLMPAGDDVKLAFRGTVRLR